MIAHQGKTAVKHWSQIASGCVLHTVYGACAIRLHAMRPATVALERLIRRYEIAL